MLEALTVTAPFRGPGHWNQQRHTDDYAKHGLCDLHRFGARRNRRRDRNGHPYRPMLESSGGEVMASTAALFGLPVERGFLVEQVQPGSPTQAAGLRAGSRMVTIRAISLMCFGGDIIFAVDGEPLMSAAQLAQILLRFAARIRVEAQALPWGPDRQLNCPSRKCKWNFGYFHLGRDVMAKNPKAEVEATIVSDVSEEQQYQIRQRGDELYAARGQEDGHDVEDWLQAKAEIGARKAGAAES